MGMDLSMVQTPSHGDIPDYYPEAIRKYPGYFRGVPYDALDEAGVLDDTIGSPKWPAWPPGGLTVERAEQLRDFFDSPSVRYLSRESHRILFLAELKPTFRELRIIQRYRDAADRARSTVSKKPGTVPSFKFGSNDGWHVIPEECLVIAYRLGVHLEEKLARDRGAADGRQQSMRLKFPHGDAVEAPTHEQLVEAIRGLDHKADDPYFIVEDDAAPHAFMQTKKESARLFLVEYSEGDPQRQYRAEKVRARVVEQLFTAYLRRDTAFKTAIGWEEITEELFGDYYRELQWLRGFIAFNELAAKYGGYEVW